MQILDDGCKYWSFAGNLKGCFDFSTCITLTAEGHGPANY